jgi:hypothetical protein
MDLPNLGPHASVVGMKQTARRITYRRGYGNVVSTTLMADKLNSKTTPYNRIQPASGKFGDHAPVTADPYFKMLNPQTNLAWDNTQPIPATSYQNSELPSVPSKDSTQEN